MIIPIIVIPYNIIIIIISVTSTKMSVNLILSSIINPSNQNNQINDTQIQENIFCKQKLPCCFLLTLLYICSLNHWNQ